MDTDEEGESGVGPEKGERESLRGKRKRKEKEERERLRRKRKIEGC